VTSRGPLSTVPNSISTVSEKRTQSSTKPVLKRSKSVERFHHIETPIGDKRNIVDVAEYQHIIWRTLNQAELDNPAITFQQNEISLYDRGITMDNMSHIHYRLGLSTNGLYVAYGMIERYLAKYQLPKNKLKLYACAAIFIGSKIEDYLPPKVRDVIKLADHCWDASERTFTSRELFAAEVDLINSINFDTTFGTPLFYLTQLMRISGQTQETLLLARYILEIIQTDERFIGMRYSKEAAVAVMVCRILCGEQPWTPALAGYTSYSEASLSEPVHWVRDMLVKGDRPQSRFMKRKYGSDLFKNVAHIKIPSSFV
jgi:hypothetical protein